MAKNKFRMLSIPLQNTDANEVWAAGKGVASRSLEKPAPHRAMARAIDKLETKNRELENNLKQIALVRGNDAKRKAYDNERGTLGALEFHLKSGMSLPEKIAKDRKKASKDMYEVLFKEGRSKLAQDAEGLHAQVGLTLSLIDDEFEKEAVEAEAAGIVDVLHMVHKQADRVLNVADDEEPPEIRKSKKAVIAAIKSVIMQANAWADDDEDAADMAFYYLVPLQRWMERAKESREASQEADQGNGAQNGDAGSGDGSTANPGDAPANGASAAGTNDAAAPQKAVATTSKTAETVASNKTRGKRKRSGGKKARRNSASRRAVANDAAASSGGGADADTKAEAVEKVS